MSLDWTSLKGHIDPVEAGSETVRGGYVWIAARATVEATLDALREHPESDPRVLELGAGTGIVSMFAAQVRITS